MCAQNVVIVESPAKAKTINKYLGEDFEVLASMGHVRDLPAKNGSVDPENNFAMQWEISDRSQKSINEITRAAKKAKHIYLATDPDREGEAISWHLADILKQQGLLDTRSLHRVTFNEITKNAVKEAFSHPRDVEQPLVDAYLARRALDYLVGFGISPILWRKLPGARSAGRVQSVALRLICEREHEIELFNPQEYWSVEGQFLTAKKQSFTARLTHLAGKKLEKFSLTTEADSKAAVAQLVKASYTVQSVERKQVQRHPAAPFITSTLQQEASRKLGFGVSRTMRTAQRLYEGVDLGGETVGLITYMRTDGPTLSGEAIASARSVIAKKYGDEYVPSSPRQYASKSKNAQEAHEAIRPTDISRTPDMMRRYLKDDELALYDIIWKRTVASQMASAKMEQVAIDIAADNKAGIFRANGSIILFNGFLALYREDQDDADQKDPEGDKDADGNILPPLTEGDTPTAQDVIPHQHFTEPPPRYSEASLVKKLEELGIGRPSTYASIIDVIQDRGYARIEKKRFIAEERGRVVTAFLQNFFPRYVEYDFTANLEQELDNIAEGHAIWRSILNEFWGGFSQKLDETKELRITEVLDVLNDELAVYLFPPREDGSNPRTCPTCKTGSLSLKPGKFGFFIGCSNYPECKFTRQLSQDGGTDATPLDEPVVLGTDPQTGFAITLRKGPYGAYVQLGEEIREEIPPPPPKEPKKNKDGTLKAVAKPKAPAKPKVKITKPKRSSLPAGTTADTVTLEQALSLLALPRFVGNHPETGDKIEANLGRFGPYLKYQSMFVSIPKADDMFTIAVDRAAELIAIKAAKPPSTRGRFGRKKAAASTAEKPAKKTASKKTTAKKATTAKATATKAKTTTTAKKPAVKKTAAKSKKAE
jgi:DNA topoisomerase-1